MRTSSPSRYQKGCIVLGLIVSIQIQDGGTASGNVGDVRAG